MVVDNGDRARHGNPGDLAAGPVSVPPAVRPFLAVGAAGAVGGGMVAAISGPANWQRGSWLAAFLVLVVGVGQITLGVGQSAAHGSVTRALVAAELLFVNAGAALVVVGTLSSRPVLATAGSVAFAGGVAVFAGHSLHGPRRSGWVHRLYEALLMILAVSAAIGIALSWLRA